MICAAGFYGKALNSGENMKKLINEPTRVTREMLEGMVAMNPSLALLGDETVVIRSDIEQWRKRGQVALISGGGAGHEPAHAGYVGEGMLTAAVSGEVFTSPSTDAVLAAIRTCAGTAGVLLIIKNYTGDRLNFGLAAELARAQGIAVDVVIVADDAAFEQGAVDNRRGIAGTVFVHKVAGAAAAAGLDLAGVKEEAARAALAVRTMGVALSACTVPAVGSPGFELPETEIELGLGIHGEQGVQRARLAPADQLVDRMLDSILADRAIVAGDRVALLVNGLGGTPPMELSVVVRSTLANLRARGVAVARAWSGTLLSALEMPGCSLSLLRFDDASLRQLDAATTAAAWPGAGKLPPARLIVASPTAALVAAERNRSADTQGRMVQAGAMACADALVANESRLTELDSAAGDGDLGISMARGAAAIRALPAEGAEDAAAELTRIAGALRRAIAGSSGPFYAVGLLRAARHLAACRSVDAAAWADAFGQAVEGIAEMGGARPGDRTMLDALHPAVAAFKAALAGGASVAEAWAACVEAAERGAADTAQMQPRLGRASYLGGRALGVEDGGAVAVAIWLRALGKLVK